MINILVISSKSYSSLIVITLGTVNFSDGGADVSSFVTSILVLMFLMTKKNRF